MINGDLNRELIYITITSYHLKGVPFMKLPPCPNSRNCVSTMGNSDDRQHYMDPIAFSGEPEEAKRIVRSILKEEPLAEIEHEDVDYMKAVYKIKLLPFKDDVEFYFGQQGFVHFRSASRIGYSDLGKNKKRMNDFTKQFREAYNKQAAT